jgi:hypothetical protein
VRRPRRGTYPDSFEAREALARQRDEGLIAYDVWADPRHRIRDSRPTLARGRSASSGKLSAPSAGAARIACPDPHGLWPTSCESYMTDHTKAGPYVHVLATISDKQNKNYDSRAIRADLICA